MQAQARRTPAEMLAANWRESRDDTRPTTAPDSPPEFPRRPAQGPPVRPPRPASLDVEREFVPPGLQEPKASGAGRHAQDTQEQQADPSAPARQRLRKPSNRSVDAGNQTNKCTSPARTNAADSDPDRTMSSITGEPLCRVDCRMWDEESKVCDASMDPPRPANPAVPSGDKGPSVGVGRQFGKLLSKLKNAAPAVLEPVVLLSFTGRSKAEGDSASVSSRSTNTSIMSYLVKRDVKKQLEKLQEEEDIRRGKKRPTRRVGISIESYEDHGSWVKLWERENDMDWICPNLECEYHYQQPSWKTPNKKNHKTRPPPLLSPNGLLTAERYSPKMIPEDMPTSMSASTYQSFQFSAQSPHGRLSIVTAQTEAELATESPNGLRVDRRHTISDCPNDKAEASDDDGCDMSPLRERQIRKDRFRAVRSHHTSTSSQVPRPRRTTGPERVVDVGNEHRSGPSPVEWDGKRGRDRRVSLPVEGTRRRVTIATHAGSPRTTKRTLSSTPPSTGSSSPQTTDGAPLPQVGYPQRNRSVLEELSRWSEEREEESRRPMMTEVVVGSKNGHKIRANRGGIRGWF